jgi:hypothetical protein
MKLMIFLAVWKRPEITEICFMGINRLRNFSRETIDAFAVISEESMIPLCNKYDIKWAMANNHPLGAKKNYGIKEVLKYDFDYLIEIGSDDLLKNEVLTTYKWDSPVMGLMDFALIDTQTGDCKSIKSTIPKYGAGRAIKRFVLESCEIWENNKSRGMDNSSCRILATNGFLMQGVKSEEPLVVALKSDTNLWGYDSVMGKKYPIQKAFEGLSEEEVNAINYLIHVAV